MASASQRHSTVLRSVEQLTLPMRSPDARELTMEYQIQRALECGSFGASVTACATAAGLDHDKQVSVPLRFDKGQFSRWQSDAEGVKADRLRRVMQLCGNVIPILWLANDNGLDPHSMRWHESELERRNRELLEENDALRRTLMRGVR